MASWSDLYRRDNNLERANTSLRNPAARVRVSNMADSKGVVADPILSTIWVSPQILQGRLASLLFWVGLWGVYGLRKQNKIFREQSLVWARSQLHDFDARQEEAESYRRIVIQNNRYRIKSA